ncbi:MAG: tetratricopeptide repeat protein, partial [Planctomycetota bacterium]|nr:tetratricopeptide repeat protein [Planctomycetota bacterium]
MDPLDRARNDARLGRLILETRAGAGLSGGIRHLRAAVDTFDEMGCVLEARTSRIDLGRLYLGLGDCAAAVAPLEQAYAAAEAAGEVGLLAETASRVAEAHRGTGDYTAAMRYSWLAVGHAQAVGNEQGFADEQLHLARLQVRHGQYDDAIEGAEQALEIFADGNRAAHQAACMETLALAFAGKGEDARSDSWFSDSVECFLAIGSKSDAIAALLRHAQVARERGRAMEAIVLLERVIKVARQADDKAAESRALRMMARIRADGGEMPAAEVALERALDMSMAADDHDGQARIHYLRGRMLVQRRDLAGAIQSFTAALGQAQQLSDTTVLERVLAAMTKVHRQLGSHDQAMETLRSWEQTLRERGDRREQLRLIGTMAEVQEERGAWDEAETNLRWLLSACIDEADAPERIRAHKGLGVVLSKRGEMQEAVSHFAAALHECDTVTAMGGKPPVSEAQLCYRYANTLLQCEQARAAVPVLERGLMAVENDRLRTRLLVAMGNALAMVDERIAARGYFEQAVKLCEQVGDHKTTKIIRRA